MATLRKLIDGKAIGDTTQDLLDQVEQAQNSKNSYETEKHKLNLQMIPTKAALEYISQQHGLNPSQTPSPNNPDDMYTDLPSQGNQMNPRGGGRGTAEQSLPGKGELGEIGQNPGNRTGMVPGTPGRSIQAPNRERQLPPGQQQTMKKQAPFPKANKGKASTSQKPRQFSVHVKAKAMTDCKCGGTCMSCRAKKIRAGGPGSGRHPEGGNNRKLKNMIPVKHFEYSSEGGPGKSFVSHVMKQAGVVHTFVPSSFEHHYVLQVREDHVGRARQALKKEKL